MCIFSTYFFLVRVIKTKSYLRFCPLVLCFLYFFAISLRYEPPKFTRLFFSFFLFCLCLRFCSFFSCLCYFFFVFFCSFLFFFFFSFFFLFCFFFFYSPATPEIYTLSLHDALPISSQLRSAPMRQLQIQETSTFSTSPLAFTCQV